MATTIHCDVCGELQEKEFYASQLFSASVLEQIAPFCHGSPVEDMCPTCVEHVVKGITKAIKEVKFTADLKRDLAKKKMPNGITRKVRDKTGHSKSQQLREKLCEMIDEGTRTRTQLCAKLHELFPNYKSPQALGPRISDVMNPTKSLQITKKTAFEGRLAVIDTHTSNIVWRA